MELLLEKETVKRVQQIISKFDPNINIIILSNTAKTATEAASCLKCDVGAIVKSLLFKAGESFLICLVAGDKRCSLNKLKFFLNNKNVSMANPNEVKKNTGFSIGGVSPVGHKKKLVILIDKSLHRFKNVFAAAGHPKCVFKINYKQLIKITNGIERDITE